MQAPVIDVFFPLVVQEAVQVSRDENQNYKEYTISSPASLSPGPYSPEPPSSPDRKGGRITPTSTRYDFATLLLRFATVTLMQECGLHAGNALIKY